MSTPRGLAWRRLGLQAGVLLGLGLAFTGGAPPSIAAPPPGCFAEHACTFRKPLLVYTLEYSARMNLPFDDRTRWQAALDALVFLMDSDNGYVTSNYIQALVRYGHDPDPGAPGTAIVGDTSGLVDGVKLDVPLYDADSPGKPYLQCDQADAIKAALAGIPPPIDGIDAWTRGGLAAARAHIQQALADHPDDALPPNPRLTATVVLTQGIWSSQDGGQALAPPAEDPAPLAADMHNVEGTPTFVVHVGDAASRSHSDELGASGGTGQSVAPEDTALTDVLKLVIEDLKAALDPPVCAPIYPRVMILLDASSGMLNVGDGALRAPMGQGGWEAARAALSVSELLNEAVNNRVLLGLAVFGDIQPAEEKLLFQYDSCHDDNLAWALDPATSCLAPGCTDPYGAPPISWTFADGEAMGLFLHATTSHIPRCEPDAVHPEACAGSRPYAHRGLNLVQDNIAAYKTACAAMDAPWPCEPGTPFLNIMITEGLYASTDTQVQAPLKAMFSAGVTTYVLGLGDRADSDEAAQKLAKMAGWGSGGLLQPFTAATQPQLEASLAAIVAQKLEDSCCKSFLCELDEEGAIEPDPVPEPDSTGTGSTGPDGGTTGLASTGTGASSTGDDAGTSATGTSATGTSDTGAGDSTILPGDVAADPTFASTSWPGPDIPTTSTGTTFPDGETGELIGDLEFGCGCRGDAARAPWALLGLGLLARRRRRALARLAVLPCADGDRRDVVG